MNKSPITEFQGGYRYLSNFWPARVVLDSIVYPTVEHAYVAAKTLDLGLRRRIASSKSAGEAKRLGRTIKLREDWDQVKLAIMEDLVRQKFTKDPVLRTRLAVTFERPLLEGNAWGDEFWGVDLKTGRGQNHLGKILMKIRDEIGEKP